MLNQKVKSVLGGTIACQSNNTSIRRELCVEDHGYQFSPTHKRYLQKKHQQICRFNRYANSSRKEKSVSNAYTPAHGLQNVSLLSLQPQPWKLTSSQIRPPTRRRLPDLS